VIANKGPRAAGAFDVDFLRAGEPEGTATVAGLEPGALTTVTVPALPCVAGEELAAIADPRAEVEESDEENNGLTVSC
jgi:subtilase family serine protease